MGAPLPPPGYPGMPIGPTRLSYARKHVCQACGLRGSIMRLGVWWCSADVPMTRKMEYPPQTSSTITNPNYAVQPVTALGTKVGS